MEYIVSQKELDGLVDLEKLIEANKALEAARLLIIKLAKVPCGKTYCDLCPISDIGYYDHDDPEKISTDLSRRICKEVRHYSK